MGIEAPEQKKPDTHMSPVKVALIGVIAAIGLGFIIVDSRSLSAPRTSSTSWVGLGTLIDGAAADPNAAPLYRDERAQSLFSEVTQNAPFVYIPPAGGPAQAVASDTTVTRDIEDILAAISPKEKASWTPETVPEGTPSLMEAYSFIPKGLFQMPSQDETRTELQQQLYDYGNELGSLVQDYESTHQNVSQIATDQLADRGNPEKAAALKRVGDDLILLGQRIERVENVPSIAAKTHAALGKGYQEVGAALKIVAEAVRDQELLDAVTAYNKTMDRQIPNYIAVVDLFTTHSVSFSPDDPGSAFSFTPAL